MGKIYIDNVEVGGRVRQLVVVGGPDGPDMWVTSPLYMQIRGGDCQVAIVETCAN